MKSICIKIKACLKRFCNKIKVAFFEYNDCW